jgi:hypothetical protein
MGLQLELGLLLKERDIMLRGECIRNLELLRNIKANTRNIKRNFIIIVGFVKAFLKIIMIEMINLSLKKHIENF